MNIQLGNKDLYAVIDDEHFDLIKGYRWFSNTAHGITYALSRSAGKKAILMHRLIIDAPAGMLVDHIDRNGLNNQLSNLRLCTIKQNNRNKKPSKSGTGFKGVQVRRDKSGKNKYRARYNGDGQRVNLGSFDTPKEAHEKWAAFAKEKHGEFFRAA